MIKLTPSQGRVLLYLARLDEHNQDGSRYLHGRGRLASAQVLCRLGYAEFVGLGTFNGERWRITEAGRGALEGVVLE